jgi:hypothetical protein
VHDSATQQVMISLGGNDDGGDQTFVVPDSRRD